MSSKAFTKDDSASHGPPQALDTYKKVLMNTTANRDYSAQKVLIHALQLTAYR